MQFIKSFDFEYGRCDRLSERVERVIANNPGPFTFTGTGTYIVGGSHEGAAVAVIDPGPLDEVHLDALLRAIGSRAVSHILVTHTHADHSPLSERLSKATGAAIYAAPLPHNAGGGQLDAEDDDRFSPDVLVSDGDRIEGHGWTLEVVATPGHASNHICFALLEENGLFSGDHIMGWSTTIVAPPDGNMSQYMASLDKVIARDFHVIWPTHGAPITDVAPFLAGYKAHRLERERQILERLSAGDRTIAEMVPVLYAAVSPSLWPAASLSVLSHLQKLVNDGTVSVAGQSGLEGVWTLVQPVNAGR
ncbi:MBL fold metallo-hydrolase [uncultured Brevundimonas sp.]|uniref:MBL fold metallo-hydrolase n=1 Tax=uncultured Brevundimonas sp. TaxID=213418 RepID=UPI00260687C6|nr:MBL fold metallo-hydrolase [uncultured Brevundimonas sp.]